MHAHLAYLLQRLRASYWLVPALMGAAAAGLASAVLGLDADALSAPEWAAGFAPGPAGARDLLSAITAAAITVSGLVFSLTLVALTLAAQQLSPRIIAYFMGDRRTQAAMGVFAGTFIYAVILLTAAAGGPEVRDLPPGGLLIAAFLALLSIATLIYFFHHIALSIQADTMVRRTADDLHAEIEEFFPREPDAAGDSEAAETELPAGFDSRATPLTMGADGYVQAIDAEALIEVAEEHDLTIRMLVRPGRFVVADAPFACVLPQPDAAAVRAIRGAVALGGNRTRTQDVEFAIWAIVEIGVRALSPGINDPHTAIACIDHLGAGLAHAMRRAQPAAARRGRSGVVRLLLDPISFGGTMDAAFDELRQNGARMPAVAVRLAQTLALLAGLARTPAQSAAVRRHGELLRRAAARDIPEESDRRDVERHLARFLPEARPGPQSSI